MLAAPTEEGRDLLDRAIVTRDDGAWAAIASRYGALLRAWARRSSLFETTHETSGDISTKALARAWQALTPECLRGFANQRALLAYLRTCVTSAVIDSARRQRAATASRRPLRRWQTCWTRSACSPG